MINSITPNEFLTMIPDELMEECKKFRITDAQIMSLCDCLNKMRNGISITTNVTVQRLASLDLRNCRFINTDTNRTFLIKFAKHNLHLTHDNWKVELIDDINYIICQEGTITWTIAKAEDKVLPKAYKEFLKCRFQGVNMPTVNKLDTFYDRYIKNYNAIYQREIEKQYAFA